jgi:hypothetical protein
MSRRCWLEGGRVAVPGVEIEDRFTRSGVQDLAGVDEGRVAIDSSGDRPALEDHGVAPAHGSVSFWARRTSVRASSQFF